MKHLIQPLVALLVAFALSLAVCLIFRMRNRRLHAAQLARLGLHDEPGEAPSKMDPVRWRKPLPPSFRRTGS